MKRSHGGAHPPICDYGQAPFVLNVRHAAAKNTNFRTTLWTGQHMQLTVMCIPVSGDIGVEMHAQDDQLIVVEQGCAKVYTGACRNAVRETATIVGSGAALIPAGTWHNVVNSGEEPLKLWSVYAPPHHPADTVHRCKTDA